MGTGSLFIRGTSLVLEDSDGNDYIAMTDTGTGGTVEIKHNASTKLTTTATGIDVTGNVESDSVTIGVGAVATTEKLRVNGTVLTLGGSVSTPAIGIGDTNTGIYAPTAGQLGWTVNGTQRLFLDSTGLDVTGTATMDGLTVNSGTTDQVALFESTDQFADLALKDSGGTSYIRQSNGSLILEADRANASSNSSVSIKVDGSEAIRIDSSQNVGIGTTNPQKLLHVSDLSGSAQIMISSSDSGVASLQFSDAVGGSVARGYIEYDNSTNHLALGTGALERLRVDSSGNVGIGTSSPSEKLHISSTLTESLVEGTNNSVSALVAGVSVKAPFYRKAGFTIYDESDAEHFFIGRPYAGVNAFDISNRGTSRLRIDSLGLVGIGTTSPASNLHIKTSVDNSLSQGLVIERSANTDRGYINYNGGAFQFRSTVGDPIVFGETDSEHLRVAPDGNVGIGTTSPDAKLDISVAKSATRPTLGAGTQLLIESTANTGAFTAMSILGGNSSGASQINLGDVNDENVGQIGYYHADNSMRFVVNANERARIDSSGNVGIGTTSPTTPLHVYHATTDTVANFQSGDSSVAVNFTASDNSMQIATSGTDGIIKNNGAGSFRLFNNGSERVRITSTGNLAVNTTDGQGGIAGSTTEGIALNGQFNFIGATRSGSTPAIFNRITSDGAIVVSS